jgi:hypothetical protein
MSRRKKTSSFNDNIEINNSGSKATTATGKNPINNTTNNGRNTTNNSPVTNVFLDSHRGRTNNNLDDDTVLEKTNTNLDDDHLNETNFRPFPLHEINRHTLFMEQMLNEGNLEFLLSHCLHDVRTVANDHTLNYKTLNRICTVCKQVSCLVCLICLCCFDLIESFFLHKPNP